MIKYIVLSLSILYATPKITTEAIDRSYNDPIHDSRDSTLADRVKEKSQKIWQHVTEGQETANTLWDTIKQKAREHTDYLKKALSKAKDIVAQRLIWKTPEKPIENRTKENLTDTNQLLDTLSTNEFITNEPLAQPLQENSSSNKLLTAEQIKDLTPDQIKKLSKSQLNELLDTLQNRPDITLTEEQRMAFPEDLQDYLKDFNSADASQPLTPEQIKDLTPDQIKKLSKSQLNELLDTLQNRPDITLTEEQRMAFPEDLQDYLKDFNSADASQPLTPEQIKDLTPDQIKKLSKSQLNELLDTLQNRPDITLTEEQRMAFPEDLQDYLKNFNSADASQPLTPEQMKLIQRKKDLSILDLNPNKNVTFEEVTKAYRKKILQVHPDKNPGKDTTALSQMVNDAYENLKKQLLI